MRSILFCLSLWSLSGCNDRSTLFEKISPSHSGIDFNNNIAESDSLNPMNVVNIYNGGGVGIGVGRLELGVGVGGATVGKGWKLGGVWEFKS